MHYEFNLVSAAGSPDADHDSRTAVSDETNPT
jgi:hypothetical protein